MKVSEKLILLFILRESIILVLFYFTVVNVAFLIAGLVNLFQKLFLGNEFPGYINPSWAPLLFVPGMFLFFWLYKKVNKLYRLAKEDIDKQK